MTALGAERVARVGNRRQFGTAARIAAHVPHCGLGKFSHGKTTRDYARRQMVAARSTVVLCGDSQFRRWRRRRYSSRINDHHVMAVAEPRNHRKLRCQTKLKPCRQRQGEPLLAQRPRPCSAARAEPNNRCVSFPIALPAVSRFRCEHRNAFAARRVIHHVRQATVAPFDANTLPGIGDDQVQP